MKTINDLQGREDLSQDEQQALSDAHYEVKQIVKYYQMAEEEMTATQELREQTEKTEQAQRERDEHELLQKEIDEAARAEEQKQAMLEIKQKKCVPIPLACSSKSPLILNFLAVGCTDSMTGCFSSSRPLKNCLLGNMQKKSIARRHTLPR